MALAGDTLRVVNRVVYINGQRAPIPRNMKFNSSRILPAEFSDERIFPPSSPFNEDNYGPIVIPFKGMTIDLSPLSIRRWETFIQREGHTTGSDAAGNILVDGKPSTRYVVQRSYLFGMGDNRDNSLDSRFWGFIPEENIVGTPMIVYWSWDSDISIFNIFQKIPSVRLGRLGTLIR